MFCQIFISPQVKPYAIITYKHVMYELLHDLPNDLRSKDLKILGDVKKILKLHRMIT